MKTLAALLLLCTVLYPQDRKSPAYKKAMERIQKLKKSKKRPSISMGKPQAGTLKDGMQLPSPGYGYKYVHLKTRGRNSGTDEMVLGLMHIAAEFQALHKGHPGLRFGDISQKDGGDISYHGSHESGRDVDVIFLATNEKGQPVDHGEFVRFDSSGKKGSLRMDLRRNWDLVVLMLTNPHFGDKVMYIFISTPQRKLLLDYAKGLIQKERNAAKKKQMEALFKRAEKIVRHWKGHDDHFHMRIGCSAEDKKAGCKD